MKIICDDKIPYIAETLHKLAEEVRFLPGNKITAEDVRDADALIVRTRTRCDEKLLGGSRVSFVATATIGFDHLDTEWLEKNGIYWTNCPGCNADSVDQYVRECLKILISQGKASLEKGRNRLAVVGYGHVGSRVARSARKLGFEVVVSDPPLFGTMPDITDADIITFHTPLTYTGEHATYHLADRDFLRSLKKCPVIINTSRGEVVDNAALLTALEEGWVKAAVLDVWENEPQISLPLLEKAIIGTPHIAGYSANGKVNADNMVVQALCRHFNLPQPEKILPPAVEYQPYNPLRDSEWLKKNPAAFEKLRGDYPIRLEPEKY